MRSIGKQVTHLNIMTHGNVLTPSFATKKGAFYTKVR
jgi:hypothetical protein